MTQFQENTQTDGKTDEWKDEQTLFFRNLAATAVGLF